MGGKHKQAQRTKNNARPSSSGRSAELLGANLPQFSAFPSTKDNFSLVGLSVPDDVEGIDTNFQLVFKKMNKKDSTTKLKALQEFSDLVKSSESDAVVAVLPFWPRLYCALATDTEHRVREAVHSAHQEVVVKVKRNIAPFLKQLAGPWFTSQYDTYAPAACAAKNAFESAFPKDKIQEAVIFCQDEILNYICDNLTVHSAQSMGNVKTSSLEELEAKYERVIISSLDGYTLYFNKVNKGAIEKSVEIHERIISNNKFWKLAKHKVTPIRSAWFQLISAICVTAPMLLEKKHSQLTSVVFNSLSETEPTVLSRVWEAVLLTITSVPEWSTFINIEKLFMPKLWKVLQEGGQGSAVLIYRNLLPLISNLPPSIDLHMFYSNYFENMRVGLKQKSVLASRSETSAIASSFVECFQYTIMKNQSDMALCEKLIKMQLMPLLEWTLTENQVVSKIISGQISTLVQYWNRNRNKEDLGNYSRYLEYFWSNITSLFQGLLLNCEYDPKQQHGISQLTQRQVEFLLLMKQPPKMKKNVKICFEGDTGTTELNKFNASVDLDEYYLQSLNKLVFELCESYVKFIDEKQCKELIDNLCTLVQEFDGDMFFNHMKSKLSKGEQQLSLLELYNTLFSKWLKSDHLSCKYVVDLIFILLLRLEKEEKKHILQDMSKLCEQKIFHECVAKALSHPFNNEDIIVDWLRTEEVSRYFVNIVKYDLKSAQSNQSIYLLKKALEENQNGEFFISKETLDEILTILSECLVDSKKHPTLIDDFISFSSYISVIIYSEKYLLTFGDKLLLALYTFNCCTFSPTDSICEYTIWESNTAWQDAIRILSSEMDQREFLNLCRKFADVTEKYFLEKPFDDDYTNNIFEVVVAFFNCSDHLIIDYASIFFDRDFLPELKQNVTDVCCYIEYVRGRMNCPRKSDAHFTEATDFYHINEFNAKLEKYFCWRYFVLGVLMENLIKPGEEESYSRVYAVLPNGINLMTDILYDIVLGETLLKNYSFQSTHSTILRKRHDDLKTIFSGIDVDHKNLCEKELLEKWHTDPWVWPLTMPLYYIDERKEKFPVIFSEIIEKNKSNLLPRLHALQVCCDYLESDNFNKDNLDAVEQVVALRCLLHCENMEEFISQTFQRILGLKKENLDKKFYKIDFTSWEDTQLIIEIIHSFTRFVKEREAEKFSSNEWDFIVTSLASWTTIFDDIKSNYSNIQVIAFLSAVIHLYYEVTERVETFVEIDKDRVLEWQDVFEEIVQGAIIKLWFYYVGEFSNNESTSMNLKYLPLLEAFSKGLLAIESKYIFEKAPENAPKWSKILKCSLPLLISSNSFLQLWGYRMLIRMTPGLIDVDSISVTTNTPHEKGLIMQQFKEILLKTQDIVQAMLLDFKLGEDSCTVEPFTDSYTYTFGYFLLWDVLLILFERASTELNYQYSDWMKKDDLLNNLLNNIFKLLPSDVFHDVKSKQLVDKFTCRPKIDNEPNTSEKLEHLVCWVYSFTLLNLPASVRQWWTNAETKTAQIVERVTSEYLSTHLCNQELSAVEQHENKFKNMVIKVLRGIRTVKATYTVDEAQMELLITLPTNYPLGGPDIQCNREIGGSSHKQWLMQLKMCVLHQNGRIWDGLSLWNHNLDKKFDGVEECYICFAVLHPGTYQLPKLSCHTCKKKFHSACLYKWFSTSNKSTCPICRNLF